jgi:hypothetical protein
MTGLTDVKKFFSCLNGCTDACPHVENPLMKSFCKTSGKCQAAVSECTRAAAVLCQGCPAYTRKPRQGYGGRRPRKTPPNPSFIMEPGPFPGRA